MIHIKEKNKGKFTESAKRAGKYAQDVLRNPNSTPLQRKRALFAAKKFKHKDGGKMIEINFTGI